MNETREKERECKYRKEESNERQKVEKKMRAKLRVKEKNKEVKIKGD